MLAELGSTKNIAFDNNLNNELTQSCQRIIKQTLTAFNIPQNIHFNLLDQFSERYKQNQTKAIKPKAKSLITYASLSKKQTQIIVKQFVHLPTDLKIQSTSIEQGHSRSFLLRTKNSANSVRFHNNRLPRIPKPVVIDQILSSVNMNNKNTQKALQIQVNPKRLKIQSKGIQLKTFSAEEIKLNFSSKQQKISPSQSKTSVPVVSNHNSSSLKKTNTAKIFNKKDSSYFKNDKDKIDKIEISMKSILIKYRKGYLIYDQKCQFAFKNSMNLKNNRILQRKPPQISAQHYCVLDINNLKPIYFKKSNIETIQIASLTKIVTCLLTILACKKYDIDCKEYKCRVSDEAASMIGTSAELQTGDILSIYELLFGLMLPSGNDAAVALAQNIGKIIQRKKKIQNPPNPINTFIKQMNVLYKQLIINQDEKQEHIFKNPSGLSWNPNYTTVEQISIFAAVACQNQLFCNVINTKFFENNIMNQRYGITRKIQWKNTNKLLWKDWQGVKTGTTQSAGHCFIGKQNKYIITLIDCISLEKRFSEAELLKQWLKKEDEILQ